jgi:hypothetical protein
MSGGRRPAKPPGRTLNDELSEAVGRDVVKIEALPIAVGQSAHLVLEGSDSPWRQGVRLVTDGVLRVAGVEGPQLDIWTDTAPPAVEISCVETDGLLRFYNVWQSGRRPGVESRSATSGMLVEDLGDGWRRYSCNDIGVEPDFEKLVFRISID